MHASEFNSPFVVKAEETTCTYIEPYGTVATEICPKYEP